MMDLWKAKTHPHHQPPPLLSHPQSSAILSPLNMFWGKGLQYPPMPQAAAASLLCRSTVAMQDIKHQQTSRGSLKLMMTRSMLGCESPSTLMSFTTDRDRHGRHDLSDTLGGAVEVAAAMAAAHWTPFSAFRSLRNTSDINVHEDCAPAKEHILELSLSTKPLVDITIAENSDTPSYQMKHDTLQESKPALTHNLRTSVIDLDNNGNKFTSTEKHEASDTESRAGLNQSFRKNVSYCILY